MGFGIDRARLDGTGVLQVEFAWPDAKSPADFGANADRRKLGIALYQARLLDVPRLAPVMPRRRGPVPIPRYTGSAMDLAVIRGMTGVGPAELALSLESLGLNCEFGLFQRRCGVEPLGLLRFTGIALGDLIAGLEAGFAGLEDIGNLSCRPDDNSGVEWIIRNNKYRLEYHTNRSPLVTAAADILRQQQRILPFRRAKLRDILATGEKLFVVSRPEGMTQAQALPLLTALRDHGPMRCCSRATARACRRAQWICWRPACSAGRWMVWTGAPAPAICPATSPGSAMPPSPPG